MFVENHKFGSICLWPLQFLAVCRGLLLVCRAVAAVLSLLLLPPLLIVIVIVLLHGCCFLLWWYWSAFLHSYSLIHGGEHG